ncbi:MAG TPA: LytTR family DNA-binding domain-containing protein, partial [Chitinophagaceae bacterium]|nr:LytTR family DNA-binding domain-containing protein [Chitinophagaceae bacterium]
KNHLQQVDRFELVGVYRNAREALQALTTQDVDLMFLDIRLPGMSGLQFLQSLPNLPLVVLTTAYAEYALEGYEFNVIDYLLKPISFERFLKTINKIVDGKMLPQPSKESEKQRGDHFFVKSNSKFFRINFSAIKYIEGMKDYLKIHTGENTLIAHQTMTDIEKLLPAGQFIRVHKSYIVAISHIRAIYGNSIEVNSMTIPIGISYKDKVMGLVSGT